MTSYAVTKTASAGDNRVVVPILHAGVVVRVYAYNFTRGSTAVYIGYSSSDDAGVTASPILNAFADGSVSWDGIQGASLPFFIDTRFYGCDLNDLLQVFVEVVEE